MSNKQLDKAKSGDINAFFQLYSEFQSQLKSYLYRLLVDRNDVEDIAQDTFMRAFDKIATFDEKSSLKSWTFRIATNLAYDRLRSNGRWSPKVLDKAKKYAHSHEYVLLQMKEVSQYSKFDILEHIDFCFTCIAKVLPLEQQIAVILKELYEFKVKEIAIILEKTVPATKHILRFGRQTMINIFDNRCSFVNKKGMCHQCSELNTYLNPKQKQQEIFIRQQLLSKDHDRQKLFKMRKALIRSINPLTIRGAKIHDVLMQINRKVEGEIDEINFNNDN
ncbi:sigma-70 family RNA polymerase sigma factor [Fulvivirgaceae bacterium BMA10]|uniref:Sigma-70 family RNA polymerase sigma factor n=1 Tax=Splendidivirga corallicola TaxID=3051826 RepID=A0ABT8KNX2_9BACT|nr:sigma-70 family RNA polymerase sigma factor [Fulvivirgaceae bacterium BMA10]